MNCAQAACARVLDHLRCGLDHRTRDRADELVAEGLEQLGLVPARRRAWITVGHLDRSGRLPTPAGKRISTPSRDPRPAPADGDRERPQDVASPGWSRAWRLTIGCVARPCPTRCATNCQEASGRAGPGAECSTDDLRLVLAGLVIGVDQRRLGVAVPHPLLQRSQRDLAGGGDARAERVPQVVEAHDADAGAAARALEALADLERSSGLPVSGCAKTRSSSAVNARRRAARRAHARAPRPSARRGEPRRDFGGLNSPRTHACRTRTLRADGSRSSQRSPSSSPCRSPVMAAIRYSGAQSGPMRPPGSRPRARPAAPACVGSGYPCRLAPPAARPACTGWPPPTASDARSKTEWSVEKMFRPSWASARPAQAAQAAASRPSLTDTIERSLAEERVQMDAQVRLDRLDVRLRAPARLQLLDERAAGDATVRSRVGHDGTASSAINSRSRFSAWSASAQPRIPAVAPARARFAPAGGVSQRP